MRGQLVGTIVIKRGIQFDFTVSASNFRSVISRFKAMTPNNPVNEYYGSFSCVHKNLDNQIMLQENLVSDITLLKQTSQDDIFFI